MRPRRFLAALALGLCLAAPAWAAVGPKSYGITQGWPAGPGQVGAVPALQTLTLSTSSATAGSPFSATVQGVTGGSTLVLTNNVGGLYSLAGTTLSGSGLSAGTDNPAIQETLSGAIGSPNTTVFSIVVAASGGTGGQLDFSTPVNSAWTSVTF